MSRSVIINGSQKHIEPLCFQVLQFLREQGKRGVTAMDAMRALGVTGGSLTKRISDLHRLGFSITRTTHKDPITKRRFGKWVLLET